MKSFPEWIRTLNGLRRLERYYRDAERNARRAKGPEGGEREQYYAGRCIGFLFSREQLKRQDLTAQAKEDVLARYRHGLSGEDLDEICSFIREYSGSGGVGTPPAGELPEDQKGLEELTRGVAEAIGASSRLLDDIFNYMSLREILFSMLGRI